MSCGLFSWVLAGQTPEYLDVVSAVGRTLHVQPCLDTYSEMFYRVHLSSGWKTATAVLGVPQLVYGMSTAVMSELQCEGRKERQEGLKLAALGMCGSDVVRGMSGVHYIECDTANCLVDGKRCGVVTRCVVLLYT